MQYSSNSDLVCFLRFQYFEDLIGHLFGGFNHCGLWSAALFKIGVDVESKVFSRADIYDILNSAFYNKISLRECESE